MEKLRAILVDDEFFARENLKMLLEDYANEHIQLIGEAASVKEALELCEKNKIDLVFSFVDNSKQDVSLEFYNTNYSQLTLSGELQLAQKWSGIVKTILATNKNWEKEANKSKIQDALSANDPAGLSPVSVNDSKRKTKYDCY